ncbi:hypothetical protein BD779DRAFT_1791307 [Infundibulicybe gibba]|nr:hypothetical protein BD779DRAFT_1791307 [Infundibulicybe gibba]
MAYSTLFSEYERLTGGKWGTRLPVAVAADNVPAAPQEFSNLPSPRERPSPMFSAANWKRFSMNQIGSNLWRMMEGVNEKNADVLYQTLVSSILLRPHPIEANAPMLSSTSHIRVQVEQSRMDLLHWISKRSLGIRQEDAFDELEGWAIKEISDRPRH